MTEFLNLTKEQNDIAQFHEELSILSRKVYEQYPTQENKDDLVQSLTNFKEYLESVQMSEDRHIEITHPDTDIDFNIYYTYNKKNDFIHITGIYLYGNQVDLVEVIDDCIIDDIIIEIEYKLEEGDD